MGAYSEEEKLRILEELSRSGMSIQEFGTERGISVNKLYGWRRRRASARKENTPRGEFVKIPSGLTVTIELSEGVKITVPVEGLKRVLAELGVTR